MVALVLTFGFFGCASKMDYPLANAVQGSTAETILNVIGAPKNANVRINGVFIGPVYDPKGKPLKLVIAPGSQRVEILSGDRVLYNQPILAAQGNSVAIQVIP
jgi:hypothetical protein